MSNTISSHIDQTMIKNWLFQVTPAENLFEQYYRIHGELCSMDELYDSDKHFISNSIGMEANTNLRSINQDYIQLKETMLFSETDWFLPFLDVAIHKHLRYFPAFMHTHSFFEMCYVISGTCSHSLRTPQNEIPLTLNTGDLLIIPPGVEHSLSMTSDSTVVNILIRESSFETAFLKNLPSDNILYNFFSNTLYAKDQGRYILCHSGLNSELLEIFYHIAVTYCNNLLYANNIIDQLLSIFFSVMLREHSSSIEFAGDNASCSDLIPSISQYIETNYPHTNVQSIAKHYGFNASYLGQLFKKSTGSTLVDALIRVRMSKAKKLLDTSTLSVDLISEMVGYEDVTHFIRLFKRYTGLTPLQYRKQTPAKKS